MTTEPVGDELITGAEFALRAGVSRDTIKLWRFEGTGPEPVRRGPSIVRYRSADVDRFIAERRRPRRHTAPAKAEALRLADELGVGEAARRTGVPAGTISSWRTRTR